MTTPATAALVVQTSYVGDVVLTTPLLAALAERGPVDVVVTPAGASLLANHPAVRAVIPYDKRDDARGMSGLWRTSQTLKGWFRENDPEGEGVVAPAAYLAQSSVRSALLAMLAGCRERVGFTTSPARALCTRTVPYREDRHHSERLWSLAAPSSDAEPSPASVRPRLYPGDVERLQVERLLRAAGHSGEPMVALAPGSAWGTKRWPYYPVLAAALHGRVRIVVVGGREDRASAAAIAAAVGSPPTGVIDASGVLSLLGAAELIGRCVAIVTNDSAPQHLASAVGTPTVTIFGPTVPAFGFGPLAPHSVTVGIDALACRPCDRHGPQRCPLKHWRCMHEITVGEIEQLVRTIGLPRHSLRT